MAVATTIALVTALATTTVKLLDKLPDYDQKQKNRFLELKKLYDSELVKPRDQWDSTVLLNLQNEIVLMNTVIIRATK